MPLDKDIQIYLAAVRLAHVAHKSQSYGDVAYTRHLAHVENVLSRFAFTDAELWAAAWLHDAVEDKTGVTLKDINRQCGLMVALAVEALTDGEGANRRERKAESYFKMQSRTEVIPVKLADRIANLESCLSDGNKSLAQMYRKEHAEFRGKLHHASLTVGSTHTRVFAMWAYLDELLAMVDEAADPQPAGA